MSERRSTLALRCWLATMAAWKQYFRYEVEGLEHLASHEARIVVGYHGRPLAYDLFMLGAELHRMQGYLPLAIVHHDFLRWPATRWLVEGLEWTTGRGPVLEQALADGRHVILAPGGTREGLRPGWVRETVDWGEHLGYLRLAVARKLAIVPVAAAGVDDAYFGLSNGWPQAPNLWAAIGPLGPWPWSPPFPARVRQIVGAPITARDYDGLSPRDDAGLRRLHVEVQARVQTLLERARAQLDGEQVARIRALRDRVSLS
jgi:1-acyl-sn-glycerol-3-phosphate acyltransferase